MTSGSGTPEAKQVIDSSIPLSVNFLFGGTDLNFGGATMECKLKIY